MTEYQQLAADGVLASIMHSYVDWLRETYLCNDEKFVLRLSDAFKKYRTEVTAELSERCVNFHTRVPDTLAHLMIGFDFLLAFLNAKEEIGVQDMENYKSSFRNIIATSSVRNNSIVENENYSYQFCDKLKSLLDSGRCSVNVIGSDCDMNRKGFIGFEDDNNYYLDCNSGTATEYLAHVLTSIIDGIVKGSEYRINRGLFKLAVESAMQSHIIAALNDVDDETIDDLRGMCVDEVAHINGVINFERAYDYQKGDDDDK